jgi:hypothetical protein
LTLTQEQEFPGARFSQQGTKAVADVTRYAGYTSPTVLGSDPALTVADRLGALRSWQGLLLENRKAAVRDPEQVRRLVLEIGRTLARLETERVRR